MRRPIGSAQVKQNDSELIRLASKPIERVIDEYIAGDNLRTLV
jgi:hypothetical protein